MLLVSFDLVAFGNVHVLWLNLDVCYVALKMVLKRL